MSSARPGLGTDPDRLARVDELRREVGRRGGHTGGIPATRLEVVLEHVGDLEIAADAIALERRPAWLGELLAA